MRIFLDSFQHYGTPGSSANALVVKKWTGASSPNITSSGPNGNYGCEVGIVARTVPRNQSYGVAWKFKIDGVSTNFGEGQVCQFQAVSSSHVLVAICTLQLEPDGTFSIYCGADFAGQSDPSTAIHAGTWYTLEMTVLTGADITGNVNAAMYVRLNTVQIVAAGIAGSNIFTSGLLSGDPTISYISFGGSSLGTSTISAPVIFDDQVDMGASYNMTSHIDAMTGPVFWAGDCKVGVLFPRADVLAQWTSTGANQFSQINGQAPNPSTFVSSLTPGQADAMDFDVAANFPVVTLQLVAYANKNDAGTREVSLRGGATAAEVLSQVYSLPDDPIYLIGGRDNVPATGNQWTQATVNAHQFGFDLET